MNLYGTLDRIKALVGETGTDRDGALMHHLEAASRRVESFCGRVFWTEIGARYFDGRCGRILYVGDFLSVSEVVVDSERDNTFDGETWTGGTDFVVWPDNVWPKRGLQVLPGGSFAWRDCPRSVKVTGTWGYGNGKSATPWEATGVTGTVATTTGTTLTLSEDVVAPGHTLLIGEEQLFVRAVGTGEATVERAVNGTTAAIHAAGQIEVAVYPSRVIDAAMTLALNLEARNGRGGFKTERIGDYSYTLASEADDDVFLSRALSGMVNAE